MSFYESFKAFVTNPVTMGAWVVVMVVCVVIVLRDLKERNAHLMSLMKTVWVFTVVYSGPVGLAIYWLTGRKEISTDNLWRRSFRSVAHCYSGCGMGEIVGVLVASGLLALGNLGVGLITFVLAYVAGFALTVGPLMQGGESFHDAMRDALLSETPSIAVMEIVAIGVDLLLAGNANMGDPIFWSSLVISLTCGLVAAYPVNVLLIHYGVKEGMMDPHNTEHAH